MTCSRLPGCPDPGQTPAGRQVGAAHRTSGWCIWISPVTWAQMVFAWPAGGTFSPVVFKECQVLLQHIHSCLCGWCRSTNARDFASYLETKWRRRHNNAKNTWALSTNPWEEQHSSFNCWKQSQQQLSSQCSNRNRTFDPVLVPLICFYGCAADAPQKSASDLFEYEPNMQMQSDSDLTPQAEATATVQEVYICQVRTNIFPLSIQVFYNFTVKSKGNLAHLFKHVNV